MKWNKNATTSWEKLADSKSYSLSEPVILLPPWLCSLSIYSVGVSSTPSTGELAPTKRIQAPQQNKALPPDPVAPAPAPAPVNMQEGGFVAKLCDL